jgi:FKBP-type peptidyl-prolyl cis-trans isomerase FkpA
MPRKGVYLPLKKSTMRKLIPLLTVLFLSAALSCGKSDDSNTQCNFTDPPVSVPASEITALEGYLASKGITNAVRDTRGFYYIISNPGTGATPTVCSRVSVNYVGKLTNDAIFDQTTTTPASFFLGQTIAGWIKGVPLIKAGGRITLFLPPSLGYGNVAIGPIPANSILIFDVDLLTVAVQ